MRLKHYNLLLPNVNTTFTEIRHTSSVLNLDIFNNESTKVINIKLCCINYHDYTGTDLLFSTIISIPNNQIIIEIYMKIALCSAICKLIDIDL